MSASINPVVIRGNLTTIPAGSFRLPVSHLYAEKNKSVVFAAVARNLDELEAFCTQYYGEQSPFSQITASLELKPDAETNKLVMPEGKAVVLVRINEWSDRIQR